MNKDHFLKTGNVIQTFGDSSESGPYLLKRLPFVQQGYLSNWVNLYNLQGVWSHCAHLNTLRNQK